MLKTYISVYVPYLVPTPIEIEREYDQLERLLNWLK